MDTQWQKFKGYLLINEYADKKWQSGLIVTEYPRTALF